MLSAVSSDELPAKHSSGTVILDFARAWARHMAILGDDKKARLLAKQQCRRQWDLIHPVPGMSAEERNQASKTRFQKETWPYVQWAIKRFLSVKNDKGLYVLRSPASALRHWDGVRAEAANRPRPRPRPLRRHQDLLPAVTPITSPAASIQDVAATPQASSPPLSAYQTPLTSPAPATSVRLLSPIHFVRAPSHRLNAARLPRKNTTNSPRIKVERKTPKSMFSAGSPRRVKQSRLSPWVTKTKRVKKESASPVLRRIKEESASPTLRRIKKQSSSPDKFCVNKRSSSPDYLAVRKRSSSPDYLGSNPGMSSPRKTADGTSTPCAPSTSPVSSAPSTFIPATPVRRDAKPFRRLFSLSPDDSPGVGPSRRLPNVSPVRGGIASRLYPPMPLFYVSDSEDGREGDDSASGM
ncbi:hypothetical protein CYLTODRAFT_203503 [Cylindrobasidium torrendii FP15055 ss-10]|uniref:Uncharacterized protein n=1 Tax=Cylindrobasidium torrendii FP15055 ss-10 TaxID=1314674 RepID=A0A0D7AVC7_9AGAR|nr:hypothetical protein CYLTODRAFT_203503 [Cylindrobasidium torrendii FP15055 ss-10]